MANSKKYALGIDLGGTKTLAAVVDITTGEVIASERKRTHAELGQDHMSQHSNLQNCQPGPKLLRLV